MSKSFPTYVVVGAGAVGVQMVRELAAQGIKESQVKILARSTRNVTIDGVTYPVRAISPEEFDGVDIALFAGTEGEKGAAVTYAREACRRGCFVIDNGADFRMEDAVPLIVPEINARALSSHEGLVANPNCSTIIMLMALHPLYSAAGGIHKIIATTFQAVSGAGKPGIDELQDQIGQQFHDRSITHSVFPHQIHQNVIPQIGSFDERGETTEEIKMRKETHKILCDWGIKVSARCVRVPVLNGHCMNVVVSLRRNMSPDAARDILRSAPGVHLLDDPSNALYPMPLTVSGFESVFVGLIRANQCVSNGLELFIAGDNLRKGAALNAVQIAQLYLGQ